MAGAEVGDDVLGDDPTVQRLEATIAERLGLEAALFVPSGTMANLLAIAVSTRRGDEVLLHIDAHPFQHEAGGAGMFAGVQLHPLGHGGPFLDPTEVLSAVRPPNDHYAPATLLCVEDTVNKGGGAVYPLDRLRDLHRAAHGAGLATHLDGARLFHAVVASATPADVRVRGFDSVATCFSKGLGAPVGSALVSDRERIALARRYRKALGGGMRQSGVLAAAALYALDPHGDRLAEDHARARALGDGLATMGFDVEPVATNMVYVGVDDGPAWQQALSEHGVACFAHGPRRLRLVVHLDVDDAGIRRAIEAFGRIG